MKNRIQQILIAVIMITCIFVGLHYLYKTESEKKFKETFAENKEAFVDLNEKLLVTTIRFFRYTTLNRQWRV